MHINPHVFYVLFSDIAFMKIKDMCEGERPREKMLARGAGALSDGELLAVLLRGGTPDVNVLDIARELLKLADSRLSRLSDMPPEKISAIRGIGPCKAASLIAAFELGRRFYREESLAVRKPVTNSEMVFRMMLPDLKGLGHEECWVLFMNNHNYVISREKITSGGQDSTVIDVRQIVRKAIEKGASGIILVHNHPTGNPQPSAADIKNTAALKKAAASCSISLIDHVVVSDDCYFSFSEN